MTVKVRILSVKRSVDKGYLLVTYQWGDPPTSDWVVARHKADVWRIIDEQMVEYHATSKRLQEAQSLVGKEMEL